MIDEMIWRLMTRDYLIFVAYEIVRNNPTNWECFVENALNCFNCEFWINRMTDQIALQDDSKPDYRNLIQTFISNSECSAKWIVNIFVRFV